MFFIFLLFFQRAQAIELPESEIVKWSQSNDWKRLLHYKKNVFGIERSLLDGDGFFFVPIGRKNALAELHSTIEGMKAGNKKMGKFALHPQCAFPARLQFLKEKMKLEIEAVPCPKVDEFMATFMDPQTVSVIFSSAYANNPASMFGHSFLKINSKKRSDLTDIGINFAAHVSENENPMAFIYFGIMGGYPGQWSTENYYDKVKTYVQGENRDLWEYELNFSPEDTRKLLLHLWELETNSYFDYYFFDENCSYQILAAIEAVRPDWNLTEHKIYFIPGESIKGLFRSPDIVRGVHLRPSAQRIVMQKYEALNRKEEEDFFALIQGKKNKSSFPLALEAGMAYLDFLNVKKKGRLSEEEKSRQLSLLLQRAALGPQLESQKRLKPIVAETRPDLGHDSYSIHLSQTVRQRADKYGAGSTTNFKIKSSYHDLMNSDLGFKRYSHIDFPAIEFQYDSDLKSLRLNEINALSITSLPPINFLSYAPAWKVESGLYTARDYGCLTCRHVFTELGIGAAANFMPSTHLVYAMFTVRGEAYHDLGRGYRYGPGLEVGTLFNPLDRLKFRLSFKQFWDVDQEERSGVLQNYLAQMSYSLARNFELRNSFNFTYPVDHPELRNTNISVEFIYFFN